MPNEAPVDSNVSNSGSGEQTSTETTQNTQPSEGAPSGPIKLSDDAEIIWEGAKEPVKFGNLRGLQSQFTKVSQARAELERNLKARQDELVKAQNVLRSLIGQQIQTPQQDPYAEIKSRPYVTGEQAAQLLTQMQQSQAPMVQVLQAMAAKVQQLEGALSHVNRDFLGRTHEQKIRGFLSKIGLDPEEYFDEADIFYRAHEGDDLDEQFPDLFKDFVKKREDREKRLRQRQIEQARNKPFVPGKGGFGSADKELGLKGNETPQELADKVWTMINGGEAS